MPRDTVLRTKKFQVVLDTTPLPDGRIAPRHLIIHPGAVAILPIVDADHVCLLRNFRPAVGAELWEIPAGTLDPGEPPDTAAVRELAEETGYRAARWHNLREFFPSPGILSETMYLYAAEELTPGSQQLEPDEHIEPKVVSWRDALTWARDGTIRDAKTLIALLTWERWRGEPAG
jgi:ADP-ribose pyrophosphatase